MKKTILMILLALLLSVLVGCESEDRIVYRIVDIDDPPQPPQGVYSVTGDSEVYLYFNGPYDDDIVEYIIWRSYDTLYEGNDMIILYDYLDERVQARSDQINVLWQYEFIDNTVTNGVTYDYAVSSVDAAGQESDLSAESVFDTPRPEGYTTLYDAFEFPNSSGYDLSSFTRTGWDDPLADVFVEVIDDVFFLTAGREDTDMQDMGYTYSFDDIDYAPDDGWAQIKQLEVIEGHTYVIWTADLHYAKMRVEAVTDSTVSFYWGYQTDQDNRELTPSPDDGRERSVIARAVPRTNEDRIQ